MTLEISPIKDKPLQRKYPELIPLWIAVFTDILGFSLIIPLLPYLTTHWGISGVQIGFILSVNAMFGLLFGPIWGKISDLIGRKPALLICQFGTLAAFLLVAFSSTYYMLIFARIIDGIFGGNFPIVKAIIGDIIPPKRRSIYMSNIGVAHILSSVLAPGIGGLMAPMGLLGLGLLSSVLCIATIILTFIKLYETNPLIIEQKKNFKKDNQSNLNYNNKSARQEILDTIKRIILPKHKGFLRSNKLALFLLIQWLFHTISFFIFVSTLTLFAKIRLEMTIKEISIYLTFSGIIRLFMRFFIFVPLIKSIGERKTSILGLTIFPICFFLIGIIQKPIYLAIILCFVSFAASCSRSVLTSYLSRSVQKKYQGVAMGYNASLDSVAQIIGPLIGGAIIDSGAMFWYGGSAGIFGLFALVMAIRNVENKFEDEKCSAILNS